MSDAPSLYYNSFLYSGSFSVCNCSFYLHIVNFDCHTQLKTGMDLTSKKKPLFIMALECGKLSQLCRRLNQVIITKVNDFYCITKTHVPWTLFLSFLDSSVSVSMPQIIAATHLIYSCPSPFLSCCRPVCNSTIYLPVLWPLKFIWQLTFLSSLQLVTLTWRALMGIWLISAQVVVRQCRAARLLAAMFSVFLTPGLPASSATSPYLQKFSVTSSTLPALRTSRCLHLPCFILHCVCWHQFPYHNHQAMLFCWCL